MHVKIQGGGGGVYGNSGSSGNVADYLEEGMQKNQYGKDTFFNHRQDSINPQQVIKDIDENKKNLMKSDAKFYVITVSPSREEIRKMGSTTSEQKIAFKGFIKNDVMQQYAENFKKGLKKEDIRYYACIHENRKEKPGEQLHAHIIVSRKSEDNRLKLSPQTNHSTTQKGAVKGGFSRTEYFKKLEAGFDQKFGYNRTLDEKFEYKNALKKGDYKSLGQAIENYQVQKRDFLEKQKEAALAKPKQQTVGQNKKQQGRGLSL